MTLRRLAMLASLLVALALAGAAQGAVSCSVAVTSISVIYDPTLATDTVTTGSYTVSCTRLASDANTFSWQLGANNGLQPAGQSNQVALSGKFYAYEVYRTPPYTNSNRWMDTNSGNRFAGTLNFGTQLTATYTGAFDLRLAALQAVQPSGTYTDTVTATLRDGTGTLIAQTTFNVSVITNPSCTLTTPPGSVNLAYTSFQASAASASTTFGVSCTTSLPYTMALDATSGTLVGLSYTLALSQTSGTGTGVTQNYSITGSIAAGQAGTCATAVCSASAVRTLTISY